MALVLQGWLRSGGHKEGTPVAEEIGGGTPEPRTRLGRGPLDRASFENASA
jgi:hypothetical protein